MKVSITYDDTLYQLVPKEPTLDMGWAYLDAANKQFPLKEHSFNHDCYRAMLSAAPTPPAQPTEIKPLTDKQIAELDLSAITVKDAIADVRAVEAAHGINL